MDRNMDIGIRARVLIKLFSKPATKVGWKTLHKMSDSLLFKEICTECKKRRVKPVFRKLINIIINHREFNGYHIGYRYIMENKLYCI